MTNHAVERAIRPACHKAHKEGTHAHKARQGSRRRHSARRRDVVTGLEAPGAGWRLYVHPAFSEPFDALTGEVERLAAPIPRVMSSTRRQSCLGASSISSRSRFRAARARPNMRWATHWDPRIGTGGAPSSSAASVCSSATARRRASSFMHGLTTRIRCARQAGAATPTQFSEPCCARQIRQTDGTR
jgi:hypothetical protein